MTESESQYIKQLEKELKNLKKVLNFQEKREEGLLNIREKNQNRFQ